MASWSEQEWAERWIPLTTEMPPKGKVVWVWLYTERVKAYRSGEGWVRVDTNERVAGLVTHFMWVRE